MWPQEQGQMWPQGYNLNNLGRDLLDKAVYQKSKDLAFLFQTRICFKLFPIKIHVKRGPLGGAIFGPRTIIWTILEEVH